MTDRATPPRNGAGADFARELRSPLTAIVGYLQLLDDEGLLDDPGALRRYLSVVRGQAADLARLVSELASVGDAADGRRSDAGGPATLSDLVRELAGGRPVRVEASADAAAAPVDGGRLRLVLWQLLDNAVRFGTPGADVLVRATLGGEPPRLVVRVTNRGTSAPDGPREPVIDPSRPAAPTGEAGYQALGLGLPLARRAAEEAGGSLVLEAGVPTTFRLDLPLWDDPAGREARSWQERAIRAEAEALRAMQDLRALRSAAVTEQAARQLAEAQQLRAVQDFRAEHHRAVALADHRERAYLETMTALARAVEARDMYTGSHIERVRSYSLRIAGGLGIAGSAHKQLEYGAVLHDIGKIGIPDAILAKAGPLAPDEWDVMRRHPEIGRRVLEGVSFLAPALDAVAHHHERWDGGGYPGGLAGEAIPMAGRIVAVADAFDAMTSDRPYRSGRPLDVALAEIERGRGTQFDPDAAAAFLANPPPARP